MKLSFVMLGRVLVVVKLEPKEKEPFLTLRKLKLEKGYEFSSYEAFYFLEKYYDKRLEVNCHDNGETETAQKFMESYKGFMKDDHADGLGKTEGRVHPEPLPEY